VHILTEKDEVIK